MTVSNKNHDKPYHENGSINLSEAASKLRSRNSSPQEKRDAAIAMGKKGGHQNRNSSKKKKEDDKSNKK